MRFSFRALLFIVAAIAIFTFAAMRYSSAFLVALILFGAVIGSVIGRHRFWSSCLYGGLGCALASWIGLMMWAFVLPWDNVQDPQLRADVRKVYQNFVRETFVPQSAFVMFEGFVIGVVVAIVVYVLTKIIKRWSLPRSSHITNLTPKAR